MDFIQKSTYLLSGTDRDLLGLLFHHAQQWFECSSGETRREEEGLPWSCNFGSSTRVKQTTADKQPLIQNHPRFDQNYTDLRFLTLSVNWIAWGRGEG